jgi:hypothetical protein
MQVPVFLQTFGGISICTRRFPALQIAPQLAPERGNEGLANGYLN